MKWLRTPKLWGDVTEAAIKLGVVCVVCGEGVTERVADEAVNILNELDDECFTYIDDCETVEDIARLAIQDYVDGNMRQCPKCGKWYCYKHWGGDLFEHDACARCRQRKEV